METLLTTGERLAVPERVIVAPASGRFRPLSDGDADEVAAVLDHEEVIGYVDGAGGRSTPVASPFRGLLMGLMAHAGERVREGQPVAWLRLA